MKLLSHSIITWVYNLCFHPLADFPGPFLGRASLVSPIAGEIQFCRCKMASQLHGHLALAIYSYIDWEHTSLYRRLAPEIRYGALYPLQ